MKQGKNVPLLCSLMRVTIIFLLMYRCSAANDVNHRKRWRKITKFMNRVAVIH